jgi:hypothetical protein
MTAFLTGMAIVGAVLNSIGFTLMFRRLGQAERTLRSLALLVRADSKARNRHGL